MDINPLIESNIKLKQVEQAIRQLHYELDMREHGGIAAHRAISITEEILNLPWIQGSEKRMREIEDKKCQQE